MARVLLLAAKSAALLALMVSVLYLTVRAKRFGFDRFQSVHSRRKYRVPVRREVSSEAGTRPPPAPPP